jgi:hypothetical protein
VHYRLSGLCPTQTVRAGFSIASACSGETRELSLRVGRGAARGRLNEDFGVLDFRSRDKTSVGIYDNHYYVAVLQPY